MTIKPDDLLYELIELTDEQKLAIRAELKDCTFEELGELILKAAWLHRCVEATLLMKYGDKL